MFELCHERKTGNNDFLCIQSFSFIEKNMFLYGKSYFVNKKKNVGLVKHHRNCRFVDLLWKIYTKTMSPQLFRKRNDFLNKIFLLLLWLNFRMFLVNRETLHYPR